MSLRQWRKPIAVFLSLLLLLTPGLLSIVRAEEPTPNPYVWTGSGGSTNPGISDLEAIGYEFCEGLTEFKFDKGWLDPEEPTSDPVTGFAIQLTFTNYKGNDSEGNPEYLGVDFTANMPLYFVVVKAGSTSYIYYYSDTTLTGSLVIPGNQAISHVSFFYCPTLWLSGYKFHDLNADGMWGVGEPALGDWVINLWAETTVDEVTELRIIDTTQTNEYGYYSFGGLEPDVEYYISEVLPNGWRQSLPTLGDPLPGIGYIYGPITLPLEAPASFDFGNYQYASVSGYKWHDLSNDGIWDIDEPVLANWTIKLWTGNPLAVVATTTTDADGYYEFTALMPNINYFVSEVIPAGWEQTFPTDPAVFVPGEGHVWGPINLLSQGVLEDRDFGNYKLPDPPTSQTAWAYDPDNATPNWGFVNNKFWGWTNGGYAAGSYELEIWAGAGQNDLSKGTPVGTLYVTYAGGTATVKYEAKPGFSFSEFHLWVGNTPLPQVTRGKKTAYTNAPGQFPHIVSFDAEDAVTEYTFTVEGLSGNIYVAAHAVVWGYFDEEEEMTVEAQVEETDGGGRPSTVDIGDAASFGEYISTIAKEGPKGASSMAQGRNK